ncbi:PREDICTED: odorant receptor 85b-like isoform X3 [Vollenhovia emeryi]|uniref:odorant receptor 85b-like isoform X3 n=1 Tax=Vollenhovia emeryi TaxID=411798 RepID=UPI0005F4A368|nr:PREDICTED: odorant receptor 85b-like isoform X3 [Vollenhovia emeryi]
MESMRVYFTLHGEKNETLVLMDNKKSAGYRDFMWATEVHRFGLEMFGLWPKNVTFSIKSFWSQVHAGIILILLVFVNNVPIIYTIMEDWGDMVLVIGTLRFALPFVLVPVKYAIMRWKRTVLLSTVNMMEEDWIAFKSDAERTVMLRRAQTARLVMIFGYFFIAIAFFAATVPTYFDIRVIHVTNFTKQTKLPLEAYHFYNIHKSPQLELTFFFQNIATFLEAAIYMVIDIFLLLVIFHICGQLENFRYRLISLVSCKNFDKTLHDIVVFHLRLIKFANNIENTYTLMMLIMIFNFVITFCFCGFLMTIIFKKGEINKDIVMDICFLICTIFCLLMNTFFYCGAGELVVEQSNAVYRAICDLEWYKLEPKKSRNLILLMIRANHPFHITAGKIIPLTIATYCNILKTSCGYISFLLTKH